MNKILANIRAVPGVWGTIAIDKKRALTYQLLPSSYTAEDIKRIALSTLNLGRSLDKSLVVDFFFENGRGRLYNRGEAIVLILGREELSFDDLGSICKEAIPAISRRFAKADLSVSAVESGSGNSSISFDLMLKAINIIASNVQQKIGAYLVTKHLRNSKDSLVEKHQFLAFITVDNNGVATLIKGCAPDNSEDLLRGFAHWANVFISSCAKSTDKLNPEDILGLTLDIREKLELTGFYQLYADVGI